jgi:hypothetical protein
MLLLRVQVNRPANHITTFFVRLHEFPTILHLQREREKRGERREI